MKKIIEQLEPAILKDIENNKLMGATTQDIALLSIAISFRRIADTLTDGDELSMLIIDVANALKEVKT